MLQNNQQKSPHPIQLRFSQHYSKLDRSTFTTIRRTKRHFMEGQEIEIVGPTGSLGIAVVIAISYQSLNEMETAFLLADTDCHTREDAITLLNSFYSPAIPPNELLTVLTLRWLKRVV